MAKKDSNQLNDIRVVERHINQGLMSKEDKEKYIKSLPDDAENVEHVDFEAVLEEDFLLPKFPPLEAVDNLE